ncbi:MAG: glycosyltransferase [Flavobacteriales bacterium]|nr:glycosyltransferase [Flavobacteriales bacterium]MCB9194378.1 glycosyltransferase [Flavobacteriales bacterium]
MAEKHLHIVSFDVPWPPDYGGVIDVFYKVKALAGLGVRVHLHCFEYGRRPAPELEAICASVHYYHRSSSKHLLLSGLPYVVVSRRNEELIERLLLDDHPILFEGLHSCYFLGDPRLQGRRRSVRTHNVEHDYYGALAKAERSAFRKAYFVNEARKLERFEPVLSEADHIIAISPKDQAYFMRHFGRAEHVPAFHACGRIAVPGGIGDYALYHGALSVPENDQAALYLVREVFPGLPVKLIIAGSGASPELRRAASTTPNVELREDIPTEEIHRLVREAQVNVLPTFQATGIKLKLLLCLFTGRHVVCNTPMVQDTGLEEVCLVHDDPETMRLSILACMSRPANGSTLEKRMKVLEERFDNRRNAEHLARIVLA